MGQKLNKLFLLVWKNFLIQWRHPKQTAVEILAPVLFSSLLVLIRSLVNPELHPITLYTPFNNNFTLNTTFIRYIAWSPQNSILEKIVHDAMERIFKKTKIKFIPISCNNSKSLEDYLTNEVNLLTTLAGVQFDDSLAEAVTLPKNVTLTLRFPAELRNSTGNWRTNRLFPTYQVPGPRSWTVNEGGQPGYYREGFLILQQELSMAIINSFKPINEDVFSIAMQRFPYPKWVQDDLLTALQMFVGLIVMLSFVYTCISIVKVITVEKERQLKEVMKIMGLPSWLHWMAWFIKCFTFLLLTVTIIVVLVKAKWYSGTDQAVFTYTNPIVIFLFLVCYIVATITFCFAVSVFFSKATTAATVAGMLWFLSHFPYTFLQKNYNTLSLRQKLFASLGLNTAMAYGFQLMLMFEGTEEGLQWHNLWKPVSPDDNLVLGHLIAMLLVDALIYLSIALYVEAVFPGDYGVPLPWYFPVSFEYWRGLPKDVEYLEYEPIFNPFLENEPANSDIGIKIHHLRKEFGKKVAVKNLCLNVFKDQITVLLGHNGAGKTTTMSMLTGLYPPTSGTAFVDSCDIRTEMPGVRRSLGLCPQHNILFDELTVAEHIRFYCQLKGFPKERVNSEIIKYIDMLELVDKKNAKASTLSGGMKRKLSVGVALCGDSSVVLCDEPTAGMDPASRRALWDLLLSQKKNRTILLTTHYMDEADLLGDRIAIMAEGELRCCGSSFFLKKKYITGYRLIMDKAVECNVQIVTALLQNFIPHLRVDTNVGSELSYILPEQYSMVFEEMLGQLEMRSADLGVLSYGISLTSLEEVFMKVYGEHDQEEDTLSSASLKDGHVEINQAEQGERQHLSHVPLYSKKNTSSGYRLWWNQFQAMVMKRCLSVLRAWILLFIQNCIPVVFLILAIVLSGQTNSYKNLPNLKMTLHTYGDSVTVVTETSRSPYANSYKSIVARSNHILVDWKNENITEKMLEQTVQNTAAVRQRYICGATFEENSITAWFNNQPYHATSLSLQLITNAVLQKEVSPDCNIQVHNHPLPFKLDTKLNQLTEGNNVGFQIAFNLGFSMAFVSAFYVIFYVRERASKAKHLQFVSGMTAVPFWGAAFLCDMITFAFTSILVVCTLVVFQEDGFRTIDELGRIFSILLYFGFAMLPMMYLASYLFDIASTGYTRMALINIFTGVAAMLVVQVLSQPELNLENTAKILHWLFLLVPHYSFSTGIRDVYVVYATHSLCNSFVEKCVNFHFPGIPNLTPAECKAKICKVITQCCITTTNYYDMEPPGIGRNVLFSSGVGAFFIMILFTIEFQIFNKLADRMISRQEPLENSNPVMDSDVLEENMRIRGSSTIDDIVVIRDITKHYGKLLAVNKLCLGIDRYECFGLLGVNGAGKTTTFKILTGDIKPSSGTAFVSGFNLKSNIKKVYQLIGYCPQFDALLDDLTCEETLVIFGLIRGMSGNDSKSAANELAKDLDLHKHFHKRVKQLSGGNKRKLSTAVALIGDPIVLYLDEPTAGMDAITKRNVWKSLCRIRDSGKCIVLTSHSMEECEALCTRLAIMVNGSFVCLGSIQHLKSKYSEGYTLAIKIRMEYAGMFEPIENFVKNSFDGAIVRERHHDLVTFYIANKVLPLSRMFGIMERAKSQLNIEDYSIGQNTLEQVFLSFTKYQRER